MLKWFRGTLAKSESLNASLGSVEFETSPVRGRHDKSFLTWRIKRALDGRLFIGAKMLPDAYAGPDGAVENFINFDLQAAENLKERLEDCIAEFKLRTQDGVGRD